MIAQPQEETTESVGNSGFRESSTEEYSSPEESSGQPDFGSLFTDEDLSKEGIKELSNSLKGFDVNQYENTREVKLHETWESKVKAVLYVQTNFEDKSEVCKKILQLISRICFLKDEYAPVATGVHAIVLEELLDCSKRDRQEGQLDDAFLTLINNPPFTKDNIAKAMTVVCGDGDSLIIKFARYSSEKVFELVMEISKVIFSIHKDSKERLYIKSTGRDLSQRIIRCLNDVFHEYVGLEGNAETPKHALVYYNLKGRYDDDGWDSRNPAGAANEEVLEVTIPDSEDTSKSLLSEQPTTEILSKLALAEAKTVIDWLKDEKFEIVYNKPDWKAKTLIDSMTNEIDKLKDKCSALFVFIMAHGFEGSVVGTDNKPVAISDLDDVINSGIPPNIPKVS